MSALGYWQSGYFNLALVITPSGDAPDFLSALVSYWEAEACLTAIAPTLFLGRAPAKAPKPYVVAMSLPAKVGGRNTGKGYWQDRFYRVDIWNTDADQAATWAETIITEFDKLDESPLTFANGYQMGGMYLVGDTLERAREFGAGGSIDFPVTLTFRTRVGRTRS